MWVSRNLCDAQGVTVLRAKDDLSSRVLLLLVRRGDLGFGANRNAKALGLTSIFCVGDRTHLPMGESIHLPICMQNISVRIPRLFKIKDLRKRPANPS
jgi:hypothetical protein